jgi:hypothetical protein
MSNPKSWHKFVSAVDTGILSANSGLNRFAARYKVAYAFKAVEFDKLNAKTSDAYFIAFKLSLAYSALESLEKCEVLKSNRIRIVNPDIASKFRSQEGYFLLNFLRLETSNKKLLKNLTEFITGECDDLRVIAETVRHLTFHGILTANGAGISKSVKLQKTLVRLIEEVFAQINLEFSIWVEESLT